MSDERTDALEFTPEERAEADTSIPDPLQWEKRDAEGTEPEGAVEAPAEEPEE